MYTVSQIWSLVKSSQPMDDGLISRYTSSAQPRCLPLCSCGARTCHRQRRLGRSGGPGTPHPAPAARHGARASAVSALPLTDVLATTVIDTEETVQRVSDSRP